MLDPSTSSLNVEARLREFQRDGYARLGQIVTPDGLEQLRGRCNGLMLGHHAYPKMFFQHDAPNGSYGDLSYGKGWVGPSLAYRKIDGLELDPVLREWIENPLFERFARAAIGRDVSLYRAVLWNKASVGGTKLPWHQDDGKFWGIDRSPCLQIWTALDNAPRDGACVEVVPGTHLAGLASPEGGTVQDKHLEEAKALERRVLLDVKAGEALLIHNHVWHRSGLNQTDHPRRAISASFMDAATRCLRRRRAPREFTPMFTRSSLAPKGAGLGLPSAF